MGITKTYPVVICESNNLVLMYFSSLIRGSEVEVLMGIVVPSHKDMYCTKLDVAWPAARTDLTQRWSCIYRCSPLGHRCWHLPSFSVEAIHLAPRTARDRGELNVLASVEIARNARASDSCSQAVLVRVRQGQTETRVASFTTPHAKEFESADGPLAACRLRASIAVGSSRAQQKPAKI